MDEDGFFFIIDRKKEVIFSGGYNIYPSEVEHVLLEHPEVAEAAVVGMPDAYYGAAVKALVILQPAASVSAQDLIAFCSDKLANYKIPKKILFTEELPKNLLGKVLKRQLV
jgi:long-chain acyl-CoA synthetase